MLLKYSPFLLFLMMFSCCLGVSASASIFFHCRFVSTQSPLDSKSPHLIFLDTYTVVRVLFQTTLLLYRLECFWDRTLYPAVAFVSVMLLLFWFSISFLSLLGIESCDLLSLIVHIDNNYHGLAISISISVELLLLVVNHYRSLLVRLFYLFSVIPDSNISMLLNSLFCCSTYFSVEDNVYLWCHVLLVVVIPLIPNTVGNDGYMWVIGLYAPSSSSYSPASWSASTFSIAFVALITIPHLWQRLRHWL